MSLRRPASLRPKKVTTPFDSTARRLMQRSPEFSELYKRTDRMLFDLQWKTLPVDDAPELAARLMSMAAIVRAAHVVALSMYSTRKPFDYRDHR